jgi:hypothetical protein
MSECRNCYRPIERHVVTGEWIHEAEGLTWCLDGDYGDQAEPEGEG